jgi:hypothetical protein
LLTIVGVAGTIKWEERFDDLLCNIDLNIRGKIQMDNFKDHVAQATGAGRIGFGIARALSLQGAKVLLNDALNDLALNAARTICDEGGICEACAVMLPIRVYKIYGRACS